MRTINNEDIEKAQANISEAIDRCMTDLLLYSLGEMLPDCRQRLFEEIGKLRHTQQLIGEYYVSNNIT